MKMLFILPILSIQSLDAFLIFARKIPGGDPIHIEVPSSATVVDIAEEIRQNVAITGLSVDLIQISFNGDILEPSLSLVDTGIDFGKEQEVHYCILQVAIRCLTYSLRTGGVFNPLLDGDSHLRLAGGKCNLRFIVNVGDEDILGEIERQFKRWMLSNIRGSESFINVAVKFKIYYANSESVAPGLCGNNDFIFPFLDQSRCSSYGINKSKSQLVNIHVLSEDDSVAGNRNIVQRFERLKEGKVQMSRPAINDCQGERRIISVGPIAASQISPTLLCSTWDAYQQSAVFNTSWSIRSEIVLYLMMPMGYDLVLM